MMHGQPSIKITEYVLKFVCCTDSVGMIWFWQGQEIILLSKSFPSAVGPNKPSVQWAPMGFGQRYCGKVMKLIILFHLLPRLRISRAIPPFLYAFMVCTGRNLPLYHYHHKHQGLDPLVCSVSRVTTVLANVSLVLQLFSFLVVCSDMISKGFSLVAFFASVKTSSVCIRLSCLVCIQSAVHGVLSRLFCGRKGSSLPEVSITSFLPLQVFVSIRLSESSFLTHIKMWAKLKCCIFSK